MKKIILLLWASVLIVSCYEKPMYEIPLNDDGTVYLTTISTATSAGISTLDNSFSVTAYFPNAKSGDVMDVELLQLQIPPSGGAAKQLLPLTGTQKTATVGADLKATVTYTAADGLMTAAGQSVTVIFNGLTDYAKLRVDMVAATVTTAPKVSGVVVEVARTAETAYFNVTIAPKSGAYTGTLVVQSKNAKNDAFVDLPGSPFAMATPILVPISGADFAVGHDTMFYTFTATSGSLVDMITTTAIVREPYFYLKKTGTLTLNTKSDARNLLFNEATQDTAKWKTTAGKDTVVVSLSLASGSLRLQGGSEWLNAGAPGDNLIEFVPTTGAMYTKNNSNDAIAAFDLAWAGGDATTEADPLLGEGVYIFKATNGLNTFYGMLKFLNIAGTSVILEYRIGNLYAHLSKIK